jgi:hypothetical protein
LKCLWLPFERISTQPRSSSSLITSRTHIGMADSHYAPNCQGRSENKPPGRRKRGPATRRGAWPPGGGRSRPRRGLEFLRERNRGGGKVGNLVLVFHFSIRLRRRSCGNVGIPHVSGGISKRPVERVGSLSSAFQAFHSPGISTALCPFRVLPGPASIHSSVLRGRGWLIVGRRLSSSCYP